MEKIKFSKLKVGSRFGCFGDDYLNYHGGVYIYCVKTSDCMAKEENGMSFYVHSDDIVEVTPFRK